MSNKLTKIKELRNKFQAFDNPSKEFEKAIRKECDNEGIDFYLVSCSEEQFNTVKTKGNLNAF